MTHTLTKKSGISPPNAFKSKLFDNQEAAMRQMLPDEGIR